MKKIFLILMLLSFSLFAQSIEIITQEQLNEVPTIGQSKFLENTAGSWNYLVEDIDFDNSNEILIYQRNDNYNELKLFSSRHTYLDVNPLDYNLLAMEYVESEKDIHKELITFGVENKFEGYLYSYSLKNKKISFKQKKKIFTGIDFNNNGRWDIDDSYPEIYKIPNKQGKILLVMKSGFDRHPRGLYQFNVSDLEEDWNFEMGAHPGHLIFTDHDEDGDFEIVVVTNAVDNGYCFNGFADSLCYIFRLAPDGEELNKLVMGGGLSYPILERIFVNDKTTKILFQNSSGAEEKIKNNYMQILNLKSLKKENEYIYPDSYTNIRAPLNLNKFFINPHDIPIKTSTGFLFKLNKDFQIEKKYRFRNELSGILLADLNSDNSPEIILTANEAPLVFISDLNLNLIGKQYFNIPHESKMIVDIELKENRIYYIANTAPIERGLFVWTIPFEEIYTKSWISLFIQKNKDLILYVFLFSLVLLLIVLFSIQIAGKSKKLQITKQLYKFFMQDLQSGIIILNDQMQVVDINNFMIDTFGLKHDDIVDLPFNRFSEKIQSENLVSLIQSLETDTIEKENVINLNTLNGFKKFLLSANRIKTYASEKHLIIELKDLSQITNSEYLAAWGSLTQRMAHEIKNPLTTILLTLRQIQRKYITKNKEDAENFNQYIQSASEEIERLRNSTNALMKFTSAIEGNIEKTDINQVIQNSVKTFDQNELVTFNIRLEKNIPEISIDVQKIRQVLNNLLENSVDAIESEGEITISTQIIEDIDTRSGNVNSFILIEIVDNGIGIKKELLNQIFEPNFTTKNTGSGFGLAISKFIIEQMAGKISVKSKEGIGTTLSLYLPV